MPDTIRNPVEWGADQVRAASGHIGSVANRVIGTRSVADLPETYEIGIEDLREALRRGYADFISSRSDVVFLCLFYPIVGAVLVWLALDLSMLPLIFPAISGFALLGPLAAVGLYEMSRRREKGEAAGWSAAFGILGSPAFGAIFVLGLALAAAFVVWILAAHGVYALTLGPEPPASIGAFVSDVLFTGAGWAMMIIGTGIGFFFAVVVLAVSVVSFPMLVDRNCGLAAAVATSLRATSKNIRTLSVWGLIVAAGLVLGSLPAFLGLIFVIPVLGHATWHLYRALVAPPKAG